MCDAVLMDVAGLCVAARNSDYLQAALHATAEPGVCTLIGHAGGFNVATAALCNGTAAHGEDYDDTFAAEALNVMPMTPPQFGKYIADEIAHWTEVARASKIEAE